MGRLVILLRLAAAWAGWYFSKKKGYNGLLWGLLCGLVPPLVLVVLVLQPKVRLVSAQFCPSCGRPVPRGASACSHCRAPLPIDLVKCGGCGAYVPVQATCAQCKAPLK